MNNETSKIIEPMAENPLLAEVPVDYFDLRNTKVGQVKWTRTWTGKNRERKTVAVDIVKVGKLVDGKTIHIHGVIRSTKEKIIIYHSGVDSRFWGKCYHTKEQADLLGW